MGFASPIGRLWNCNTAVPSVGTWGASNHPTWRPGTPFVRLPTGTFALDTNTYGTVTSVALKSGTPNLFSGTPGTAVTGSGYLYRMLNLLLNLRTVL